MIIDIRLAEYKTHTGGATMIYIIIAIGLVAACYGGYRFGYEAGASDTFNLLDGLEEICEQIQNACKDFDKNK